MIGVVILAAGIGRRFGDDKRIQPLGGRSVGATTIDKYAESIGECYSKLRQEVIYKYFKNHDFPHPKFLGALMCTMKEYGNLYYGKNARRPDM